MNTQDPGYWLPSETEPEPIYFRLTLCTKGQMVSGVREHGRRKWGDLGGAGALAFEHAQQAPASEMTWERKAAWEGLQPGQGNASAPPGTTARPVSQASAEAAKVSDDAHNTPPSLPDPEKRPALAALPYRKVSADPVIT